MASNKHKDQLYKKIPTQSNNQKYVDRGRSLAIHEDPGWEEELKEANMKKNGAPFRYPESLIELMAILKVATGLSFRAVSGMVGGMLDEDSTLDYSTIFRRM